MKCPIPLLLMGLWCLGRMLAAAAEIELIRDPHFQRGFILWETRPGRHVRYGEMPGPESPASPVWGLSQWSSRFPLGSNQAQPRLDGSICWSNAAKSVSLTPITRPSGDLILAANSFEEYGPVARQASDPWVHLLVEQEFGESHPLTNLISARLRIDARLLRSRSRHQGDYSPARHAAQFQMFFTVQNRNRRSRGHGDLLWFGVPLYDNRSRFPAEFKARDFGGTAKFIFTPGGETFARQSTHDGEWVRIDQELLPFLHEALALAWARGFLQDSRDLRDYHLGGMNLGWELPGTFDVAMQVRNLSLRLTPRNTAAP